MFNNLMTGTNKVLGKSYLYIESPTTLFGYPYKDILTRTLSPTNASSYRMGYKAYKLRFKGISSIEIPVSFDEGRLNYKVKNLRVRVVIYDVLNDKQFSFTTSSEQSVNYVTIDLTSYYSKSYLISNEVVLEVMYEIITNAKGLRQALEGKDEHLLYDIDFGYVDIPIPYKPSNKVLSPNNIINNLPGLYKPLYSFKHEYARYGFYIEKDTSSEYLEVATPYLKLSKPLPLNSDTPPTGINIKGKMGWVDYNNVFHYSGEIEMEVNVGETEYTGAGFVYSVNEGDTVIFKDLIITGDFIRVLPDDVQGDHSYYRLEYSL